MSRIGISLRHAGYTLLELVVTLAVISLMAMTIPLVYREVWPGVGLKAAASEITSELIRLRTVARSEGKITGLATGERPNEIVILPAGTVREFDEGIEIRVAASKERLQDSASSSYRLLFFPEGAGTGGIVAIQEGERRRLIEIDWLTTDIREASHD